MNILLDEFYKSDDFIKESGVSLLEEYAEKIGIAAPKTIRYPKFSIQTTNVFADVINSYLHYIYTLDKEKKALILKKLNILVKKINISSQMDFERLENMMIRFLLRNIYFYEGSRRKKDSDLVLSKRDIEVPSIVRINSSLNDALKIIVTSKEYNSILDSIQNSSDRKKEISNILKYYK